MAFVLQSFKDSIRELRSVKCITTVGVFIALFVVLDGFGSIRIGEFLKINFAFLALAVIGMLFGPAVGFLSGFACDLVGYLINPVGGFIVWLTLITALEGMIYGLVLYTLKPEKTLKQILRIAAARGIVVVICNLLLNTIALYSYGFLGKDGQGFFAVLWTRVISNGIALPVGIVMLVAVLIPVKLAYRKMFPSYDRNHARS